MLYSNEHSEVKKYYGEVLTSSRDLQTNACCSTEAMSDEVKEALSLIHPEVLERFYGCGSPIPPLVSGLTVLDLGCGTGRDTFILSRLVGQKGRVIGVDMTDEQIGVAKKHLAYHTERFGYSEPNVEFKHGHIEDLAYSGIEDQSIDIVVSNCVINLSPDKKAVFREIMRVLKPGGELYFSDIFSDRRIPEELAIDPVLRGECLGGALYIQDFRRLLQKLGYPDYRIVSGRPLAIGNKELENKIGGIRFYSYTIRVFKVELEDRCEDYGQVAYYSGTIPGHRHGFALDDHHYFETRKPHPVCSNTAEMLLKTRFRDHFRVAGDKQNHFGLFDCKDTNSTGLAKSANGIDCC